MKGHICPDCGGEVELHQGFILCRTCGPTEHWKAQIASLRRAVERLTFNESAQDEENMDAQSEAHGREVMLEKRNADLVAVLAKVAEVPCDTFPGGCQPPHRHSDGKTESFCLGCMARAAIDKEA